MKQLVITPSYRRKLLCVLAGGCAGFLNGLLGSGGGIVLVFLFSILIPSEHPDAAKDRFAASLAVMFPVAAFSLLLYFQKGHVNTDILPAMLLPAMLGGCAGALLTDRIPADLLRRFFALVIIIAGINMLL